MIEAIKSERPELTVWAYTGFVWDELIKDPEMFELVKHCDVVVDGPFIQACKSLEVVFRGSTNQRLIDVKKTLECGKVTVLKGS